MERPTNTDFGHWKKRFFTIWSGQAVSMLGSRLVGFAFVWYLTSSTGSATVLAIGSLMSLLPDVIISPISGALVDRWNRKTVLIVFDILTALVTLALAGLFAFTEVRLWQIYSVMFLRSAFGTFQWTAMLTSTSLMVPKNQLAHVSGMNQTLAGLLGILAPPLGAFLLGILPMDGILLVDVATAFVAIIPLFFFHLPQPEINPGIKDEKGNYKKNLWQDMIEGFQFIRTLPGLLFIIITAMLINLILSPAFSLLPLLVTEYFKRGVLDLGLAESVFSIGFVVGGLVLSIWGGFKNRLITSMTFLLVMGLGVSLLGIIPRSGYYFAIAALALVGLANPLTNGPLMAAMQARVEPQKQGRVFSIINAGASLATPIGLGIAGPLSDAVGVHIWFLAGGVVCIFAGVSNLLNKHVINLGKIPEEIQAPKNPINS